MTYPTNKNKQVRLSGTLFVEVNGKKIEVSSNFKLQTNLLYSGMSQPEQATAFNAYSTALKTNADIKFLFELKAEEIKPQVVASPLDKMLEELDPSLLADKVEATIKDDEARQRSTIETLKLLGITNLPKGITDAK